MPKLPPPPRSAQKRSSPARGHAPPAAVGGDDADRPDPVEREAVRAAGEAHPAAERVAADGDVRARAGGEREPAAGEPRLDGQQPAARPEHDAAAVDGHGVERADVDHDRGRAGGAPVVGVAAGARDERHVEARRPPHDGLDVGAVADPDHGGRADPVEAGVEEHAGRRVAAVARREDPPADRAAQRAQLRARQRRRPRPARPSASSAAPAAARCRKSRRVVSSPDRRPLSPRRIAIPVRMSSAARSPASAVMPAGSNGGQTSTTSAAQSSTSRPTRRSAARSSRVVSPPGSGVPVPGAKAGSRTSMSTVR